MYLIVIILNEILGVNLYYLYLKKLNDIINDKQIINIIYVNIK